MKLSRQRSFAWLLAALLGLAHGVGEGWHFVPGNGHLVELPGGYLFVGVVPPHSVPTGFEGLARVQRARGKTALSAEEADCPICRLVAQARWLMSACFETLPSLAGHVAPSTSYLWHAPVLRPFDARAPPGEAMVSVLRMRRPA